MEYIDGSRSTGKHGSDSLCVHFAVHSASILEQSIVKRKNIREHTEVCRAGNGGGREDWNWRTAGLL